MPCRKVQPVANADVDNHQSSASRRSSNPTGEGQLLFGGGATGTAGRATAGRATLTRGDRLGSGQHCRSAPLWLRVVTRSACQQARGCPVASTLRCGLW